MFGNVSLKTKRAVQMPMICMRGVVVFPGTLNHFDAARKKSVDVLERVLSTGEQVFLVCQRDLSVEDPGLDDLYQFGVVCEVRQVLRLHDDMLKVLVSCEYRARLNDMFMDDGIQMADITKQSARRISEADMESAEALVRSIKDQINTYLSFYPKLAVDVADSLVSDMVPEELVEYLAFNLPISYEDKQSILEQSSSLKRLSMFLSIIAHENSVLQIEQEINSKVQESMAQNQRDYYLREQMNIISRELGDDDSPDNAAETYREKIEALPLADEYKHKLLREVARLRNNPSNSQEYAVIDEYLDRVTRLPWGVYTEDNYDLNNARAILDRDHYGMEEVKDRILEYLAVRARTDKINGQIICLVGPPGVGKTSIARSLAEAMGRKFVRMSLGGVKDEAEIRGHRRTYVAAMPGKLISSIQLAGTSNPMILMDEIDKLSSDYKGDPSSALLEALDPEQNVAFEDHYIDVPYDLSQVFFLTTANDRGAIPAALQDRMDVIELSSYTSTEKFHIAKEHLLPKQMEKNGLDSREFSVNDRALEEIIGKYTSEAGVRNLERTLAKLMRKAARRLAEDSELHQIRVGVKNLQEFLGPPMIHDDIAVKKDTVGAVNGLAWTSVGGVLLPVEVLLMPGSGKCILTGNLGDVMKESAQIASSYVRTLKDDYVIPEDLLTKYDIHIHAPEGAVPKDGPSAGVTLITALTSAVTGIKVDHDLAMTGEITLQGRVLAIGGLKEKLIAAYKAGISKVIIPKSNVSDLQNVPSEVKEKINIIPVERVEEVLERALLK